MLCPFAKPMAAQAFLYVGGRVSLKDDLGERTTGCDGSECGWWDSAGKQCSMVTIAIELRIIRQYGAKVGD